MTAAEKYAELGGRENAPPCKCHGLPQIWHIHRGWRCAERHKEGTLLWKKAHPEKNREYVRRWAKANPEKVRDKYRNRIEKEILNRAWQDPATLRIMFAGDNTARKLIALAFDKGATEGERETALHKLRTKRRLDCPPTQIISAGTQNTPQERESLSI